MVVSNQSGPRNRSQDVGGDGARGFPEKSPVQNSCLVSEDDLLHPDYIFVLPAQSHAEIKKTSAILSDAGFFITTRKGAPASTILLLARAGPGLVAGHKDRAQAVQERVSMLKLVGVIDKFVPHNPQNVNVKEKLGKVLSLNVIASDAQLDDIESLFGTQTAATFEFEVFLLKSLIAIVTVVFSIYVRQYSSVDNKIDYSIATLFAGTLTVARWQGRESLKSRSASAEFAPPQTKRNSFKGTSPMKRECIRLLFIPFAFTLMLIYAVGLLFVLAMEIFCKQFYDGPVKFIVKMIPVGANVAASVIYGIVYKFAIDKFTEWEDYPTEEALDDAKIQRKFYLEALLGYLPVMFTAYIYLPFGNLLIGVLPELHKSEVTRYVSLVDGFMLDKERLASQAVFYTLTQPIIGLIMRTVLPLGTYLIKRHVLHRADQANNNRFALQQLLTPFDNDEEMKSLILSFGYVLIVTPIWPLASLATTAAIYLRKVSQQYLLSTCWLRKPASRRTTREIGFWRDELLIMLLLASVVGPTIAVMYSDNSKYYDYNTSYVDVSWLKIASVALVSENTVLALYHVIKSWYIAVSISEQKDSRITSVLPVLDAEQDALWSKIDQPRLNKPKKIDNL